MKLNLIQRVKLKQANDQKNYLLKMLPDSPPRQPATAVAGGVNDSSYPLTDCRVISSDDSAGILQGGDWSLEGKKDMIFSFAWVILARFNLAKVS